MRRKRCVIAWIVVNAIWGLNYTHAKNHCAAGSINCHPDKPFDPYPFILLNLAFSTQAAYAAPLILLAQNRQDDRDRVALEEDRARAERTKADTEFLARELAALRLAVGEVVTRDFLRSELMRLTEGREQGSPESAVPDWASPDRPAAYRRSKRS